MDELRRLRISGYVVDAFHQAQDAIVNSSTNERIDTWHVSDFVSPCLRKSWYSFMGKDRPKMSKETRSVLYTGLIIHEHSKLADFHEHTFCYDIVKDKAYPPKEVKEMSKEMRQYIITGTLDDLCIIDGKPVICDKKTYNGKGWKKTKPDESYYMQLSIYRVLLYETYGLDVSEGCLLYLDKTENLEESPVSFDLAPIDKTKAFLRDTLKKLQSPPPPNICYLCDGNNRMGKIYCDFVDICRRETKVYPPKLDDVKIKVY